ncbi:MAG: TfuA-like protein [Pseudomonadota bacterium]
MICLFAGPSLPTVPDTFALPIQVLPPAACGDIYRASRRRPRVIAIIDGFFQGHLAVWHKEILWAMSQGIHVFGASSMGALRAAELHQFGMRGVGQVFEAYRDGVLEDDDEVALVHAPAEAGYAALSEPLVNVRATLQAAVHAGVLQAELESGLVAIAKRIFYQELTWPTLLATAAEDGFDPELVDVLSTWLPAGRIDTKRDDAMALLAEIERFVATNPPPQEVDFDLEWTHLWDEVVRRGDGAPPEVLTNGVSADAVLNELRLEPALYARYRQQAVLGMLATGAAAPASRPMRRDCRAAIEAFRIQEGLLSAEAYSEWLVRRALSADTHLEAVAASLQMEALAKSIDGLPDAILEALKIGPDFERLLQRAKAKRDATDGSSPNSLPRGPERLALLSWYFVTRLGQDLPDDLDAASSAIDLPDQDALLTLIAREYRFNLAESGN